MFFFRKKKEKKKTRWCCCGWVSVVLALFLLLGGLGAYRFFAHNVRELRTETVSFPKSADLLEGASSLLGFDAPKTYLFLFQNNTELRPSGGFIGSYAVVRVHRGVPEIRIVQGTEILDHAADANLLPEPPTPIKKYLGQSRWYARDANWSPDFGESARQFLALYRLEGGMDADTIDAVVGVTPTVLEEILGMTGPLTINGMVFTSENVTETLEYEVEYGYAKKGIAVVDRKDILGPFMEEALRRMRSTFLFQPQASLALAKRMIREKHLVIFSPHEAGAQMVHLIGADGSVVSPRGDYLLWVDANLGALKTDHAMERHLSHSVSGTVAVAAMSYTHNGSFDWRTSRYRTYVRVYVPRGARFIRSSGGKENVDQGEELGKQWFGTFVTVEPGERKTVSFSYALPAAVSEQEPYTLLVQKQLGTIAHSLTVDADFGTDKKLQEKTDLREDRQFYVYQKSRN